MPHPDLSEGMHSREQCKSVVGKAECVILLQLSEIDSIISKSRNFVYSDLFDFVGSFDKKDLFLLSFGATDFQRIKIKNSGIVGMGGAAFPTHVKYMFPEGKSADTLVVNGVECEPYLTSDHRIMVEHAAEILVGISVMMKAGKVDRAIIGIEANKSRNGLSNALKLKISSTNPIKPAIVTVMQNIPIDNLNSGSLTKMIINTEDSTMAINITIPPLSATFGFSSL